MGKNGIERRGSVIRKTKGILVKDKWWNYLFIVMLIIAVLCTINYFRYDIMNIYKVSYRKMYQKNLAEDKLNEIRNNLNIQDIDYEWGEELNYVNVPKKIIYHHAAANGFTAESIHESHKKKGWGGIGYHYYIRKDGTIYSGRPETAEGAHTKGKNKESIGICLEGNFEEDRLSLEQLESLYELSVYIGLKYDIYEIVGHRDQWNTLCPGKNFPVESIAKKVVNGIRDFDVEENKIIPILE